MNGLLIAKFILRTFPEEKKLWLNWLYVMSVFKKNNQMYQFLKSTSISYEQKKSWIMNITKSYIFRHAKILIKSVGRVTKNLSILSDIYPHFKECVSPELHITSTKIVEKAMQEKIKNILHMQHAEVITHIDPSILSGFSIQTNNYIIDASARNVVQQLQKKLCTK